MAFRKFPELDSAQKAAEAKKKAQEWTRITGNPIPTKAAHSSVTDKILHNPLTTSAGVGVGFSPARRESTIEKIGRYMSGNTDTTIAMSPINTNPETQRFAEQHIGGAGLGAAENWAGTMLNAINVMSENPLNPVLYAAGQYNELVAPKAVEYSKELADKLIKSGSKHIADAKEGLSRSGQLAVDIGAEGLEFAGDVGAGIATGGGTLVSTALRAFGSGAKQAEENGASINQQIAYGTLQAGTSVLTDKLSSVFGILTKAFGKGALDKTLQTATANAINRFVSSDAGQAVAKRLAAGAISGIGEGIENIVQDALTPVLQKITYDPNAKWDAEDMIYDGLVGAVLGGLSGVAGGEPQETINAPKNSKSNKIDNPISRYIIKK